MKRALVLTLLAMTGTLAAEPAANAPGGASLRIVTYNIHHAAGMDGVYDVKRIADVIRRLNPDLVALQEVHRKTTTSRLRDQASDIAEALGYHAFFGSAMNYQKGEYGEALLSKTPFLSVTNHLLPNSVGTEPRAAAEAVVTVDEGRRVRFLGTHLEHQSESTRLAQMGRLKEILDADTETPCVLAGDFNDGPHSKTMKMLAGEWANAWGGREVPTWPADTPRTPIDHVLCRPADRWRILECRAIEERVASDHLPVLAVLELGK
jgi:endonuclease/exonuclease/phosphatase family metal-dependent hydrolase